MTGQDAMINESSIKEKLWELSQNNISLEGFENWFLPEAWDMFRDSAPEAVNLSAFIHHLMDEHDDRILSDADLRQSLISIIKPVVFLSADLGDATISSLSPFESSEVSALSQLDVPAAPTALAIRLSYHPAPPVLQSARV